MKFNKEFQSETFFGSRFKLIYSVVQIVLFYLATSLFPNYDLVCILAVVITYLIPLYINSYHIKFSESDKKLSAYYLEDLIFYYLPSVFLSLIIEFILYFAGVIGDLVGFFTVVLLIIFTLLTLFQWLRYFVQYKMTNRNKEE